MVRPTCETRCCVKLLTLKEVAGALGVSVRNVDKDRASGRFVPNAIKLGRATRDRAHPDAPLSTSVDARANTDQHTIMADVVLTPDAARELDDLPLTIHARVLEVLERLKRWPNVSGAKPLRGKLSGRWRIRTGDYRVQFLVSGKCVIVERIGHRDGFYGG